MNYFSSYLWKQNKRETNEDSLSIQHVLHNKKHLILAVICDGVGGLPNGEYASAFVISQLRSLFDNIKMQHTINFRHIRHSIIRTLHHCHTELNNCATTVAILFIYNNHSLIISCGDTRIYYGHHSLRQITPDQKKNGKLLYAIGTNEFPHLFCKTIRVNSNHTFLIISDGLYSTNSIALCSRDFFFHTPQEITNKLNSLYSFARQTGEKDNCSGIIIQCTKN